MANNTIRIKANVGQDQMLHLNMQQDVDMFEMLSLTLTQRDAYRIHSSNYGVIVGRVLANNAFGVPNAKISVFVPITDEDALDTALSQSYPYTTARDTDSNNIRYNLLPTESNDPCYAVVGTFPSKRMILDNDSVLEIYDKYYKYSTVTNKAGDYMIFGVPTGTTQLHVDIDLSDIGILSQKPRDFVYHGCNINQFESPTRFKSSTALDNLAQIYSQDETVTVFPFWGDSDYTQAAITRKDINLQYEFNTTCVFLGSVVTDSKNNDITHSCDVESNAGEMSQLTTGEGTIEMIRKTPYGNVEEYTIQGNQLIDGDGVWCYQIPMNLDYVGMDEYGNIVPTDDPTKGIPTRARVRFRISMNESGTDALTRHKARYLVPNDPMTVPNGDLEPTLSGDSKDFYDSFYTFGTLTPECCFRDLMWNCVYTVKSYIPRFQRGNMNTDTYSGIKGVNKSTVGNKNPFPYNKVKVRLNSTTFNLLNLIHQFPDPKEYFWDNILKKTESYDFNAYLENIMEENDSVSLEFYNDWVNGVLYFPLWFWRMRMKKKYKKNDVRYDSKFCSTSDTPKGFYNTSTCDLPYKITTEKLVNSLEIKHKVLNLTVDECQILPQNTRLRQKVNNRTKYEYDKTVRRIPLQNGIIFQDTNKDGAYVYYYSHSQKVKNKTNVISRLYSTDIILLGSLSDNDINGIPKIDDNYPATTSNIPPMGTYTIKVDESGETTSLADEMITGMHWGNGVSNKKDDKGFKFRKGIFFGSWLASTFRIGTFGLGHYVTYTLPKTCINAERVCELGVSLDMSSVGDNNGNSVRTENSAISPFGISDGLITKREIEDESSRQVFATLNSHPLVVSDAYRNSITSYRMYPIEYNCSTDFDGSMSGFVGDFTSNYTYDDENGDYEAFRFGGYDNFQFNVKDGDSHYFPSYQNSYYFYFGLNDGNTAIEKFKKNFYDDCMSNSDPEFTITLSKTSATACNASGGSITINSALLDKSSCGHINYTLTASNGNIISGITSFNSPESRNITGLTNGEYTLNASGYNGCNAVSMVGVVTERFSLTFNPVNLSYSVQNITESGGTGSITITSLELNGEFINLNGTGGNPYVVDNSVKLELSGDGVASFVYADDELVATGLTEGEYVLTLTELCDGKDSLNTRSQTITIAANIQQTTSGETNSNG